MAVDGLTPGVKNALAKREYHSMCTDCGFAMPRYPGRYPKACPSCGAARGPVESTSTPRTLSAQSQVGEALYLGDERHTIVEIGEDVAYCESGDGSIRELPIG